MSTMLTLFSWWIWVQPGAPHGGAGGKLLRRDFYNYMTTLVRVGKLRTFHIIQACENRGWIFFASKNIQTSFGRKQMLLAFPAFLQWMKIVKLFVSNWNFHNRFLLFNKIRSTEYKKNNWMYCFHFYDSV